jgi:hypothetical protein
MIGSKSFAQIDTFNVHLEKNLEHRTGVDLVFENNSNDTIFLFTRFQNFSFGGEIPQASGICIEYFYDNQRFNFNWGELPPLMFTFSKGRTVIYPKSKVKLFFDIGYYRFPDKSSHKFEVSFFMNYIYTKANSSEIPTKVTYFQTNRVIIVEATEKTEEGKNNEE